MRLAAVVALTLGLAAGASGLCVPGSLTFDLVNYGSGCNSNHLARCLTSFTFAIDLNCNVAITPVLPSSGVYVPSLWSTYSAGAYTKLQSCPTVSAGAFFTALVPTATDIKNAFQSAMELHVYGSPYRLNLTALSWASGSVTVTSAYDSCAMKYAVTNIVNSTNTIASTVSELTGIVTCVLSGLLTPGTECQLSLATACPAGRRPVTLTALTKACPLCPPGTYSGSGASCAACDAGKSSGVVGASACGTLCAAGTYSPSTGYSACLPCSTGMYQNATGQTSCLSCPANSYARMTGATQCLKCVGGVPVCAAGSGCTINPAQLGSVGYQMMSLVTPTSLPKATCGLSSPLSFGNPKVFEQCSLGTSPTTKMALYVDATCAVTMWPAGDTACSNPAASYWSSVKLRGYYVSTTKLANDLPSSTSSYLWTLQQLNTTALTFTYWPATTDYSVAPTILSAGTKSCSGTAQPQGGQVAAASAPAGPACGDGTYDPAATGDGCRTCPVGAYCPAGSTSPTYCAAGTYQPYLGQYDPSACMTCPAGYTSEAGADSCSIPAVTACSSGYQANSSNLCEPCSAGTKRDNSTDTYCVACPPGYYSPAAASSCTACPLDQFGPIYGLPEQTAGSKKCWYCQNGTVAVNDNNQTGQLGSTTCTSCPPGTVSKYVGANTWQTCAACDDGYYRSGWGSALSNTCKQIPAGYKEANRTTATYSRASFTACDKGEVSSWSGGVRTPTDPQSCSACSATTYAPRRGMSACQNCSAGYVPTRTNSSLPGNDACTACTGNTYRPASTASATCLTCTAGKEAHPTDHKSCVACSAGWYMPDNLGGNDTTLPALSGTCLQCPANTYQNATGATSCLYCPAGYSTSDTGNTVCEPCSTGYYSASSTMPCTPAPAGSYVATSAATTYTPCPFGSFSSSSGSDSCTVCVAGQYSNTVGAKACRTCPGGTFSKANSTSCSRCSPGYYSPAGSGSCSPCKAGTFANISGSSVCQQCPVGMQCPYLATKDPIACPMGRYSSKQAAKLCTPCPINTYQDLTGQSGCQVCAQGYSTRGLTGQSLCQPLRSLKRGLRLQ